MRFARDVRSFHQTTRCISASVRHAPLPTDHTTVIQLMLGELNGVDYLNYPGARHRFGVNYGLVSTPKNNRLWLKVFLDPSQDTSPGKDVRDEDAIEKGDPGLKLDSVTGVWPGAEWLEREVYDMFGIIFVGHPDLRRILTWNGYGSYPLRKDYPLRGIGERENYKIVTREGA